MSRATPMTSDTRIAHYCKPTGRLWLTARQLRRMAKKAARARKKASLDTGAVDLKATGPPVSR